MLLSCVFVGKNLQIKFEISTNKLFVWAAVPISVWDKSFICNCGQAHSVNHCFELILKTLCSKSSNGVWKINTISKGGSLQHKWPAILREKTDKTLISGMVIKQKWIVGMPYIETKPIKNELDTKDICIQFSKQTQSLCFEKVLVFVWVSRESLDLWRVKI